MNKNKIENLKELTSTVLTEMEKAHYCDLYIKQVRSSSMLLENMASMTSISLLCLEMKTFYSKNYLCRLFKEVTGMTLSEYLQGFRVAEACRLLRLQVILQYFQKD